MRALAKFQADPRGSVNILFAFSLIPMIGLIGLGIDYSVGVSVKNKLDNAADSAAVAAVATAKAFVAANPTDANLTDDAIAAGLDRAKRAFTINAGSLPFSQVPTPTITLTRKLQTFSSTVSYATTTTNNFGQMFGQANLAIGGSAAASSDIPSYLDFYLMIDVSGSMGLPSTSSGQSTLMNNNGGCQFACHFPGQTSGFNYALNNNVQLRSGAVNSAVCGLLSRASQQVVTNQYRVGVYPFVTQLGTLSALTNDISSVNTKAGCKQNPQTVFTYLLDTGSTQLNNAGDPTGGTGAGGTHFENAFQSLPSSILYYGDGSSSVKSRPFIFLVTDGMQNSQYFRSQKNGAYGYPGNPSQYGGWNGAGWTGSSPSTMDPSQCAALKNSGATISVLYIPYSVLTVGTQNQGETIASNNAIPNIPSTLTQCATSSSYFYTANTPSDINNALAAMFNQAVQVTHLTQ